jgi:hypothetical protein
MRSSRLRDGVAIRNSAFDLLGRDGYANGLVKDRIAKSMRTKIPRALRRR